MKLLLSCEDLNMPPTLRSRQLRSTPTVGHSSRGFTLVELLAVLSIISLLMLFLLPTLSSARSQMKSLVCKANLKTIALKFNMFVEGVDDGASFRSQSHNGSNLRMDNFQNLMYGTEMYWDEVDRDTVTLRAGKTLMVCPAGPRELTTKSRGTFSRGAVWPLENVSLAMNARLHQAVTKSATGRLVLASEGETILEPAILNHPYVPIVFDVDGEEARTRGIVPFYSAPPGNDPFGPYSNGNKWIPSNRHGGATNVAFIGGHVLPSRVPSREIWDWEYQASVRR